MNGSGQTQKIFLILNIWICSFRTFTDAPVFFRFLVKDAETRPGVLIEEKMEIDPLPVKEIWRKPGADRRGKKHTENPREICILRDDDKNPH
jgi:hypothetical protein